MEGPRAKKRGVKTPGLLLPDNWNSGCPLERGLRKEGAVTRGPFRTTRVPTGKSLGSPVLTSRKSGEQCVPVLVTQHQGLAWSVLRIQGQQSTRSEERVREPGLERSPAVPEAGSHSEPTQGHFRGSKGPLLPKFSCVYLANSTLSSEAAQ